MVGGRQAGDETRSYQSELFHTVRGKLDVGGV
jgi:hypothetical protein